MRCLMKPRKPRLYKHLRSMVLNLLLVCSCCDGLCALRKVFEGLRVIGNGMRDQLKSVSFVTPDVTHQDFIRAYLCVYNEGCHVKVANVVTQLMIAWVVPVASFTAEHLRLFLRLDAFGASRDASARNAVANKAIVVATAIEGDEGVVQLLVLVPLNVQVTQLL